MSRVLVYLIGPEPDGVYLTSGDRQRLINESDFCAVTDRFMNQGDTLLVDERLAETMRSVRLERGFGIPFGTILRAVETRAHGKQVVFEEVPPA